MIELEKQSKKPTKIIVAIDGPRISNSEDKINISQILSILESNTNLSISVIKRKENFGCTNNTIFSVNEVLEVYEKVIVLEDDVSISPHFYEQMVGAVNFFLSNEDNRSEKILTVGGFSPFYNNSSNLLTRFLLPANKWRKTKYFNAWGWATSRIFWSKFTRLDDESIDLDSLFSNSRHWHQLSARKQLIWKKRFPRSWDYQVQGNLFLQEGFNIFPYFRIICNEGLGDSRSTHTRHKNHGVYLEIPSHLTDRKTSKLKQLAYYGDF